MKLNTLMLTSLDSKLSNLAGLDTHSTLAKLFEPPPGLRAMMDTHSTLAKLFEPPPGLRAMMDTHSTLAKLLLQSFAGYIPANQLPWILWAKGDGKLSSLNLTDNIIRKLSAG